MTAQAPWWRSGVVYQLYPRSFSDASGDGVGDLAGIRERLPYLASLGVDAIWLSPIYRSPMRDYGYDVADHCDVDPLFGDLDDAQGLIDDAHAAGLRVVLDFVPNHTSDLHPWFVEARSSRTSPKRDWYVWRDGTPDRPPNNWRAAFRDRPAWTWDERTEQWYLHLFLPEQPDLDWSNPEVVDAMHGVMRFWLDRGVDGFRIDVVHLLAKPPGLPDVAEDVRHIPVSSMLNEPPVHDVVRGLRRVVDAYDGDRMLVGEVYLLSTKKVAAYYGDGDELHLAFNFPPLYAPWDAAAWRKRVDRVVEELDPLAAWPTWVLSNHDNARHRTRYGGSEARARAAAVLLLGLRGTPFLYHGEELGLEDAVIPPDRVLDPGGRDGCRAPIPWTAEPPHGWPAEPWLPFPPEPGVRSAEAEDADPTSVLHLYRRLLSARRSSPALSLGGFRWLDAPDGILAWERTAPDGDDVRRVAVSFGAPASPLPALDGWTVEVSSTGAGESEPFGGVLGTDEAVVVRPSV